MLDELRYTVTRGPTFFLFQTTKKQIKNIERKKEEQNNKALNRDYKISISACVRCLHYQRHFSLSLSLFPCLETPL